MNAREQADAWVRMVGRLEALASLAQSPLSVGRVSLLALGLSILQALSGESPALLTPDGCPLRGLSEAEKALNPLQLALRAYQEFAWTPGEREPKGPVFEADYARKEGLWREFKRLRDYARKEGLWGEQSQEPEPEPEPEPAEPEPAERGASEPEPISWSYSDDTACEHDPDSACDACDQADTYMVGVLITAARDVGDRLGAPFGSSWEVPPETEQDAYCSAMVSSDADVQAELEAEGFNPEETG